MKPDIHWDYRWHFLHQTGTDPLTNQSLANFEKKVERLPIKELLALILMAFGILCMLTAQKQLVFWAISNEWRASYLNITLLPFASGLFWSIWLYRSQEAKLLRRLSLLGRHIADPNIGQKPWSVAMKSVEGKLLMIGNVIRALETKKGPTEEDYERLNFAHDCFDELHGFVDRHFPRMVGSKSLYVNRPTRALKFELAI